MTIRSACAALLLSTLGCSAAPPAPESVGPDEASLRVLLDSLREGTTLRKQTALQILLDAGPAAAPPLRKLLTRRETPADPGVAGLIRSLRTEKGRQRTLPELLLRGSAVEPDLWDAVFTTDSPEIVLGCVGLLALMDGERAPPSVLVEVLRQWGAIPTAAQGLPASGLIPLPLSDEARSLPRLRDDYSLKQAIQDKDVEFEHPVFIEAVERTK